MSYREYVIAAYAVFVLVLAWDFIVPRLQVRAALNAARRRIPRPETCKPSGELKR